MKDPALFADFTSDELVAELKRRKYGINPITVDRLGETIKNLTLGELGMIRQQVESVWEYRLSCETKGLTDEEKKLLEARDFMGCVRAVRLRLGVAIADAKAFVDKHKGGT